jgi:SAM-dependent methyltransferase
MLTGSEMTATVSQTRRRRKWAEVTANAYDRFAAVYDAHWAPESARVFFTYLFNGRLPALGNLSSVHTVLDVCCGSGHLVRRLQSAGYDVTGVDSSEKMLALAESMAPTAHFHLADIRSLPWESEFDAAVALSDSLNHLMTQRDLLKALRSIYRAVSPGGRILFDLNLELKYVTSWQKPFLIKGNDLMVFCKGEYFGKSRLATFGITLFRRRDAHWQREDITFYQRFYPPDVVLRLLHQAGFQRCKFLNLDAIPKKPRLFGGKGLFMGYKP